MKTLSRKLKAEIKRNFLSYVKQYESCRLIIKNDFKSYLLCNANERYTDESNYDNKFVINNNRRDITIKEQKESLNDFLTSIEYDQFMNNF
jgi:hypothetical protein